MKSAQIATENLMVYGLALVVIVGSLSVLFYLGVFTPSSYASRNTASGFSGITVSQACAPGGVMVIQIENTNNYPIEITAINTTSLINSSLIGGLSSSTVIQTGVSKQFFVSQACPLGSGQRYSSNVNVTYLTGSSTNPGPLSSTGTVAGVSSSSLSTQLTGGIAYTGDPGSCGVTYTDFTVLGLKEKLVAPLTCLYNGTCPVSGGDSWTAYGYMYFSPKVNFSVYVDDNAEVFYRPVSGGAWTGVNGAWIGDNAYCSGSGPGACGGPYTKSETFTPGVYEVAFASTYDHCGDGVWFSLQGAAFLGNTMNVSAIENGTASIYSSVLANPLHPTGTTVVKSASWPSSYYVYT